MISAALEEYAICSNTIQLERCSSGQINNTYIVKTNQKPQYILRETTKPMQNIQFESELIVRINSNGFPTPFLFRTTKGANYVRFADKKYQLFEHIKGEQLTEQEVTSTHIKNVASSLARMHDILKNAQIDTHPVFKNQARYENIAARCIAADHVINTTFADFLKYPPSPELNESIQYAQHELDVLSKKLIQIDTVPKIPIHGDMTLENILFNNKGIAGIIDFDDAHYDWPIFDLSVAATYFTVTGSEMNASAVDDMFDEYVRTAEQQKTDTEKVEYTNYKDLIKFYELFALAWTIQNYNNSNEDEEQKALSRIYKYAKLCESMQQKL